MKRDGFGAPESKLLEGTSGNIIHQAHHLKVWEHLAGKKIEELNHIVEIGGGYGTLARVISDLGFMGTYVIFDLPELSALQEYYLTDIPGDFRLMSTLDYLLQSCPETDLLIGIYSLSEMDQILRRLILDNIKSESYLFVYQKTFEGMDNTNFFADFVLDRKEWEWRSQRVIKFPNTKYLVGDKKC